MLKLRPAASNTEKRFAATRTGGRKLPRLPVQADASTRQIGLASPFADDSVGDALCADAYAAAVGIAFRGKIEHKPVVLSLNPGDMGHRRAAGQRK